MNGYNLQFWMQRKARSLFLILIFLTLLIVIFFALVVLKRPSQSQNLTPVHAPVLLVSNYDMEEMASDVNSVPPYLNMSKSLSYRVVPKYSLNFCVIEKVASTQMTAIFCYLYDKHNFLARNHTIPTEVNSGRFCVGRNEIKSLELLDQSIAENSSHIMMLRDPVDRFISGYTDKCIHRALQHEVHSKSLKFRERSCLGCEANLTCFVDQLYLRLMKASENTQSRMKYNYVFHHFAPQTWYCDVGNRIEQMKVIKYGANGDEQDQMITQLLGVFEERNVPSEDIEHIRSVMRGNRSRHSTHGSGNAQKVREEIDNNRHISNMLRRIYYYDYQLIDKHT